MGNPLFNNENIEMGYHDRLSNLKKLVTLLSGENSPK